MRTLSIAFVLALVFISNTSFYVKGTYTILVDKSDYELHVYKDGEWVGGYPVVFGSNDQGDKMMEGDRKTPEGTFRIISKRVHDQWSRIMRIDYPTKESYKKFKERKAKGLIPKNARIGGAIGVHGTWPREEYAIDRYLNWTLGCISLKNEHVQELYNMIPANTQITIRK